MRPINIVAYHGLHDILIQLLKERPDAYLYSNDPFGNVLHWADQGNHEPVLSLLMQQPRIKELINQHSPLAYNPLLVALIASKTHALKVLLENGADPSIKSSRASGLHSLNLVLRWGPSKHVEILLATEYVDNILWAQDSFRKISLHIAAKSDDVEAIGMLIPRYTNDLASGKHHARELYDYRGENPFHVAAESGWHRVTGAILQHSLGRLLADGCNSHQHTAFVSAAILGRTNVIKSYYGLMDLQWLLKQHEALLAAAYTGHCETTRELLDLYEQLPDSGELFRSALRKAVKNGGIEVIKHITDRITFVANDDETLREMMFLAAQRGHVEAISHLLLLNAPIDAQDGEGFTVLHHAVSKGLTAAVRILLEAGCDMALKDDFDRSSLTLSLEKQHYAIALLLLQYGARVEWIDEIRGQRHNKGGWWTRFCVSRKEYPELCSTHNNADYRDNSRREVMLLDRKGNLLPSSPREVFRAGLYLHKKLGSREQNLPLVNWILKLSEYWVATESQHNDEQDHDYAS
ncbi:Ankyrin repeat domain-containing protein 44 [Agyrium rufum]|nr:Ankyrin repeat domain-containing protein 44 [Agyrium rufum]